MHLPQTVIAEATLSWPPVEVRDTLPQHACSTWALYHAARVSSQSNEDLGLSEQDIIEYLKDPKSGVVGQSPREWRDMIMDGSGEQIVLSAWVPSKFDMPVGIVRPNIQEGERWLSNLYVAKRAQRLGVARALVEATKEWHNHQPFKLRVAEYNTNAQAVYRKLGFVLNETVETGYYIGDVYVRQLEMVHPGD